MPRRRPKKSKRVEDAIAYRTRLRLGSVMYRTRPVQHPHCWPLLQELENQKLRRSKSVARGRVGSRFRRRLRRKKGKNLRSVIQLITYAKNRRKSKVKRRKPEHAYIRSKSKFKTGKSKHKAIKRGRSKRRLKIKPKNGSYGQFQKRKNNKSRRRAQSNIRRRRRRTRYRTSRRASTRRNRSAARHRKPQAGLSEASDKNAPIRKLTSAFSLLRENEIMFGPQPAVISDNLDKGLDEIRDDPLSLSQVCRTIVHSLPGVPGSKANRENLKTLKKQKLGKDKKMKARITPQGKSEKIKKKTEIIKRRRRTRRKK